MGPKYFAQYCYGMTKHIRKGNNTKNKVKFIYPLYKLQTVCYNIRKRRIYMKRDIFHYFDANIQDVFNAYCKTIQTKFEKNISATPYHTISFALSFSFRYNMNGGSCTLHFIPYSSGTAVCVRYSIVQAMGARYGAHNQNILNEVEKLLSIKAQNINLSVEAFLQPSNQITAAPIKGQEPVSQPPRALATFCSKCGTKFGETDLFCYNCGSKRT